MPETISPGPEAGEPIIETEDGKLEWTFDIKDIDYIKLKLDGKTVATIFKTDFRDTGALESGARRSGLAVNIYDPKTGENVKSERLVKTPRPSILEVDYVNEAEGIAWVEKEIKVLYPNIKLPEHPLGIQDRAKISNSQK